LRGKKDPNQGQVLEVLPLLEDRRVETADAVAAEEHHPGIEQDS